MESSPFRVIPLLGDSSPYRGILFFRYRERTGRRVIIEAALEESRVVALVLYDVVHVLEFQNFNMCCICDAPKPGGPLTTRQPAEYKRMSGYQAPL